MLTNFGKALRKIRVEHEMTLGDLGERMNCSAAFLSALETGRKAVPPEFLNKLASNLELTFDEANLLSQLASQQTKEVSIDLKNRTDKARELAVAFARRFESMSEEEIEKELQAFSAKP